MHRAIRLLAIALPLALVTVPVALAGADPAREGGKPGPDEPVAAVSAPSPSGAAPLRPTVATTALLAAGAAANAAKPPPALIVRVVAGRTLALHVRPAGPVAIRLGDTTEFGSPQRLGVVRREGRWLGVTTPELPNGRLGWIDSRRPAISVERTRWSIHADVSRREIVLHRDGRLVRRLSVAVGRPESPTPIGRFAVTDRIEGARYGPYYGCCILAISATQPHPPPGWTGGNRMAIHGTSDTASIGAAASAGCLRAGDADLRFLMSRVPAGTPVVIRP
jgi:lipoprotein-anchoring transpeptidase ErfK/SrfK